MIEDAELAALDVLCAAATSGPWFNTDQPDGVLRVSFYPLRHGEVPAGFVVGERADDAYAWWVEFPGDMEEYEGADLANAAFIAASREAVPRLVAEVRALRTFRDAIDAAALAYGAAHAARLAEARRLRALDYQGDTEQGKAYSALLVAEYEAQDALHAAYAAYVGAAGEEGAGGR